MAMLKLVCKYSKFLGVILTAQGALFGAMPLAEARVLHGTAVYHERMMLPDGAEFRATLEDVSRAGAPAEIVGEARFLAPQGPPISFSISYDPARIDTRRTYAVRATVHYRDQLMFATDTHYPVLTQDAPETVEVTMRRVSTASPASLENTYWKATSIRGESVAVAERQREPHLLLHPTEQRLSGFGGCNTLMGGYELDQDQISFSGIASTMMACADTMDQEQVFLEALLEVARWRISGQALTLLDDAGEVLLEFESRYLR